MAVDGTVSQETENVNPRNEQTLTAAEVEATAQQVRERYEAQYGKNMTGAQQAEMYADIAAVLDSEQSNLPKGTGAAELGFTGEMTAADKWVAEAQGKGDRAIHDVSAEAAANLARQQHRAPQDVPKYDKDGRLTRAGVEAVINSGFADNDFAQRMLEETFEGAASFSQFSDRRALRKAKADIKKQGYAEATAKYLLDSFNGKVSKQSTVTGLVLLDNAIAAKDYELAVKLTVALAEDGTNSAQALQARRLLNKMTPSGKLYAVTQVADRAAAAQRERIGEARIVREADKIENATDEVKQAVAESFISSLSGLTSAQKNALYYALYKNKLSLVNHTWRTSANTAPYSRTLPQRKCSTHEICGASSIWRASRFRIWRSSGKLLAWRSMA